MIVVVLFALDKRIWRHGEAEELVVLGSKRQTSYDPSTGEEIWWAGGFSDETVGIPVTGEGLLFAGAAALGGRGDDKLDAAGTWKITVEEFDRNHDHQIQRDEMTKGFAFIQRPGCPGGSGTWTTSAWPLHCPRRTRR